MERVSKPWRIEMLGGLRVLWEDQEPVEFLPQQPSALLAYLALHCQRNHAREELIERLWPEEEAGEAVQKKMRRCLHLLRRRFEQPPFEKAALLQITRQTIGLDPDLVSTDVQDFKDALSAAAASTDLSERQLFLAQAVQLYRGDLLPGFYQDCFLAERNRLSDLYTSALHLLTQVYEQAGDLERAVECARRAVALDPLMEEAHCTLMRLFAEMGQPSAVVKQHQELERILKEEFGEEPSAATRQLMEALRERAQANVPHAVNGNRVNGKPDPTSSTIEGTSEDLRTAPLSAFLDAPPVSVSAPLPARSASLRARRLLALGAIGTMALLVALGSALLHHRTAQPKSGLLVPNAQRLWVAHVAPASDEKANSQPTAMTTDGAGNIYITGFVKTLHNDVDYLTLKYGPDGKLQWRARYNGPGNDVDRARSIAVDKDGYVYVTGESDNGKGNGLSRLSGLDWATVKYDKDGNQLWVARYNGPDDGEDWPSSLRVDGQGSVYVAGYSLRKRHRNGRTITCCEWTLVKYDSRGRQVWVQRERAPEDWTQSEARDMVLDPPGNVYVTGWMGTARSAPSRMDLVTIKYAPDGDCLWRRTYSGNGIGNVCPYRIALEGSGNVYVTGKQYDGDLINNGTQMDIVTLKYDADGNQNWVRVFDHGHGDDIPQAMAVNAAGNVCVVGSTTPMGENTRYLSLWYDPNGSRRWATIYKGTANMDDYAMDVAIDPAGNVVVTGRAMDAVRNRHAGTASDLDRRADNVTLKYDPTGRALWKGVYDEGVGWGTDPSMVTIDNKDCVLVTGQSDQGNNTPVITTIKYAPDAGP